MNQAYVEDAVFVEPDVRITSIFRVHPFTFTEGYRHLTAFIRELNEAIVGIRTSDTVYIPKSSESLLHLLDILRSWLEEFPPEKASEERSGDPSFRKWHSLLSTNLTSLLEGLLQPELYPAIVELSAYLTDSFGRPEEVDYGVGNEASFLIFLMCLYRIGFLDETNNKAVVLRVFDGYLKLCRTLQQLYRMPPTTVSQFPIDDYQFMPYVWGSAQLIGNDEDLVPESYADRTIVEKFAKDYLTFDAVRYIFQVLQKFAVVRRFRFGALFSFERREDVPQEGVYATDEDSDLND